MGRLPREFFPGGMYHILQRGHNRSYIFEDAADKTMFLHFLKEAVKRHPVCILYYVLMDNHIHLVLSMTSCDPGQTMRYLSLSYSKYYNKKYNRSGTIFGQRYKSYIIQDTKYFLRLLLYIAYNPVKAELAKRPEEYRWSAHTDVVKSSGKIIDRKELMAVIDKSPKRAYSIYMDLIREKIELDSLPDGACEFLALRRSEQLETILKEQCPDPDDLKRLLSKSKSPDIVALRKNVILHGKKQGFTTKEIADLLGVSQRCVRGT